jgi:hypothetical protein
MNYTHSIVETNFLEEYFQESIQAVPPAYAFPHDVETVYECERLIASPGYRQLPVDQQAEIRHYREQILENWQGEVSVQSNHFTEPHDDRLFRYKSNLLKSLWEEYKGKPLPKNGRLQFSWC